MKPEETIVGLLRMVEMPLHKADVRDALQRVL
jgi:hypothetical protein